MEQIHELIILKFLSKDIVSTSAFFNRFLTRVGYLGDPADLIKEMETQGLLNYEGYFNETSGIIKNIRATEKGLQKYIDDIKLVIIPESISYESQVLIKKILEI